MDSVLQFLLILFQTSGVYLGPARSASSLLRWPHCYTVVVTMTMIMYTSMVILLCILEGNAVIARQAGADDQSLKRTIEEMKPIARITIVVNVIIFQLMYLLEYLLGVTNGQRLFQLASDQLYKGLENCWPLGLGLVGMMLGYACLFLDGFQIHAQDRLQYVLIFIFYVVASIHNYFNFTMHLYSLIQNIRCLRREYSLIQSHHNLEMLVTRLPTISKIISNVHHTNLIMSTTLAVKLGFFIIQTAFSLFYVTFQRQKPFFVENVFIIMGYQIFFLVLLLLLSELLLHVFDRITRCLNAKLATKLQSYRLAHNRRLQYWRIQWFLLAKQRHSLHLQILLNITIRLPQMITIAFFTWDLSILLYQTEFM